MLNDSKYAHELFYDFLRKLSIFRGKLCCLRLATTAVDVNVDINSVVTIRSKCCESFFLRNITVWNYLLGNLFKIKLSEMRLYFYMIVFP